MNKSRRLVGESLTNVWSSTDRGKSIFGWNIPEEIFAVFFILIILALAKDDDIVNKVKGNISVQIAISILIIYCIYNKIPWSLFFIITFVFAVSFTDILTDSKGTIDKIMNGITEKMTSKEKIENKTDEKIKLGAKVFNILNKPKSILKPKEKKVTFDESESDSESDDEMCREVSKMFKFSDIESDTETDMTDTETEDSKQQKKNDLLNFVKNTNSK
jgi:hypothetical protein